MKENKSWFQEAVFYELNIRAYSDANGSGHGDFRGAIEKLSGGEDSTALGGPVRVVLAAG